MTESTWIPLAGAATASLIGFAWLALAMEGHWRQVHGGTPSGRASRFTLRVLGIASLMTSAALCFIADRPSMAVLVWLMLLVISAPAVTLTLAWRPQLLRVLWPFSRRRSP